MHELFRILRAKQAVFASQSQHFASLHCVFDIYQPIIILHKRECDSYKAIGDEYD
jgi:hypothetical protein